jgi:hypothetical protein
MSRSNELKKILKDSNFHRVGRINKRVADKAHIKCADVYIHDNNIKHIMVKHKKELEQIGLDALVFVTTIVQNFTDIRKGSGDSYLLIFSGEYNQYHSVAIELKFIKRYDFWEVKTAFPISKSRKK